MMPSTVKWCSNARKIAAVWFMVAFFAMPAGAQDLTVFAAASLKEALDDAALQFQRANGRKAVVSYAASPALANIAFVAS